MLSSSFFYVYVYVCLRSAFVYIKYMYMHVLSFFSPCVCIVLYCIVSYRFLFCLTLPSRVFCFFVCLFFLVFVFLPDSFCFYF